MDKEQALAKLRAHEDELKALGVVSLSLFGSTARGDQEPDSDVDIAVRVTEAFKKGGFEYLDRMDDLKRFLRRTLNSRVDVVKEPVRKEGMQSEIDRDRVLAF